MSAVAVIGELQKATEAIARAYAILNSATAKDPLSNIIGVVAEEFEVNRGTLIAGGRLQRMAEARFAVMMLGRELTTVVDAEIGESLGGRSPSTVSCGVKAGLNLASIDPKFAARIEKCRARLKDAQA